MRINIRSKWEIEAIRRSCIIVKDVLNLLYELLQPGVKTKELDSKAEEYIMRSGGKPAFKGYRGFPATICVSINNELVHGIPDSRRVINEGDLVSIDVGVEIGGYYGDAAVTYAVGEVGDNIVKLMRAGQKSLMKAIENAKVGGCLYDISASIEEIAKSEGYSVAIEYTGHGIGTALHEPPSVPNYGVRGTGPKLKKGMVLAIEPMIIDGSNNLVVANDGWTVYTEDGSMCVHYEHTVAITEEGADILTDGIIWH